MKNRYPIDRSFGVYAHFRPPFGRWVFGLSAAVLGLLPKSVGKGVRAERVRLGGVPALCVRPQTEGVLPALIYFHGGGFAFKAAGYHYRNAGMYAGGASCAVFVVDYSLAPKHPYPQPEEDCFAAYRFAAEHAGEWRIDASRIALGGDSAGGCLAAEVVRRAAEVGSRPCFLQLIYPVLDARMQTDSMRTFTDAPMWNARLNAKMWDYYLQGQKYRSPAEWEDVRFFPPTYIETAQFDCLHDEAAAFAEKLHSQGVVVEYKRTEGTMHGFDIARRSPLTLRALAGRVDALRAAFRSAQLRS